MIPVQTESINLINPSSKTIFKILDSPNITQSASIIGKYIFNRSFIFISNACSQKSKYNATTVTLATNTDIITPDTPTMGGRIKRKVNNVAALTTSQIALYFGLFME